MALRSVSSVDDGSGIHSRIPGLAARALEVIRDDSRRNSHQPCREWDSAPLELTKAGQRLPEHVGRQVFGLVTIAHTARDICVDAVEIFFVEVAEARRVALCGLDPQSIVGALRHRPPGVL